MVLKKLISKFFQPKKKRKKLEKSIEYRLNEIKKLVGTELKNPNIYLEALTHRSGVNISPLKKKVSNERLEFLGDSVLNLVVTKFIFSRFREEDEGQMTILRSRFVNKEILLRVANKLKMSQLLFINENAATAIESGAKSILADSIEALIGAIYLDSGLDSASRFITKYIIKPNLNLIEVKDQNFKSQLLEYVQAKKLSIPKYQIIKEEGPQHAKIFTVQVLIDGIPLGVGSGQTKKAAEQLAAKMAIDKIKNSN
ncbi:MAG: ribonuclease III [Ignavibacteria bacterium]